MDSVADYLFIPYTLMVGQLGSTFKDSEGGVSDWISLPLPNS